MPRGGKRENAGRKQVKSEQPSSAPTKSLATEILESLKFSPAEWEKQHPKHPAVGNKEPIPCACEVCLWRVHAMLERGALEYLWNRRDGKPVQTVNHLHDKPIEMNVNVKLSEIIRQVRERKREYERKRK